MGWTTYAADCSPKTRAEERAEIGRLYTTLVESAPYTAECLIASKVGSVWYLAVRLMPRSGQGIAEPPMRGYVPDDTGRIVYAGVVLTSRRDGEWGYEDLCEAMAPHAAAVPLKLLTLLSPLDPKAGRYAQGWRDEVCATHEAKRDRRKVRRATSSSSNSQSSSAGAEVAEVRGVRILPERAEPHADPLPDARYEASPHRPHGAEGAPGPRRSRRRACSRYEGSGGRPKMRCGW